MALANGDEVALARDLTGQSLSVRGKVLFGLVNASAGTDVLWENGVLAQGIAAATMLDKIVGQNAPQSRVTFTDGSDGLGSPSYSGTIVRRYTRQLNGASTTASYTLVRLDNGEYVEVPTTAIQVLEGQ